MSYNLNPLHPRVTFGSQVQQSSEPYTQVMSFSDAAPYIVTKPMSTYRMPDSNAYMKWGMELPEGEVMVSQTMGALGAKYGFDSYETFWSPSCQDLSCSQRAMKAAASRPSGYGAF